MVSRATDLVCRVSTRSRFRISAGLRGCTSNHLASRFFSTIFGFFYVYPDSRLTSEKVCEALDRVLEIFGRDAGARAGGSAAAVKVKQEEVERVGGAEEKLSVWYTPGYP